MSRKEYEQRAEFEEILASEAEQLNNGALPQWSRRQNAKAAAKLLCRHGKTYARIQEMICNGVEWMQYDTNETFNKRQARHEQFCEKREQQLEKRMRAIVESIGVGFGVIFQGDPRGATVKVTVPSGRTNDWGKEGICVPTA